MRASGDKAGFERQLGEGSHGCGLLAGTIEKRCAPNLPAEMNIERLQGKRREK
jgi:hypothetical protein